jgi:hypothetical protein
VRKLEEKRRKEWKKPLAIIRKKKRKEKKLRSSSPSPIPQPPLEGKRKINKWEREIKKEDEWKKKGAKKNLSERERERQKRKKKKKNM